MFIVVIKYLGLKIAVKKSVQSFSDVIELINKECNIDKEEIRNLYINNLNDYGISYFYKNNENSLYFIEVIEFD